MVSNSCKILVKSEIEKLGLHCVVTLGEAEIEDCISGEQLNHLKINLTKSGLTLIDDKKSILIEKIKNIIIEIVYYSEEYPKINLSNYLSEKLNYNYTYLANLFSEDQCTTIEHYYLSLRVERVKEWLIYDELNLTEIAFKMHYSSVGHLSNQFKKITGLTPSHYKRLKHKKRKTIESV